MSLARGVHRLADPRNEYLGHSHVLAVPAELRQVSGGVGGSVHDHHLSGF